MSFSYNDSTGMISNVGNGGGKVVGGNGGSLTGTGPMRGQQGLVTIYDGQKFNVFKADGSYKVPTGVSSLRVRLWGAGGGAAKNGWCGGGGAYVEGDLAVTAGESLNVLVGEGGYEGPAQGIAKVASGGGGGAENGGGGGGGRSAIQRSSKDIVTAGGGGGAGNMGFGGAACGGPVSFSGGGRVTTKTVDQTKGQALPINDDMGTLPPVKPGYCTAQVTRQGSGGDNNKKTFGGNAEGGVEPGSDMATIPEPKIPSYQTCRARGACADGYNGGSNIGIGSRIDVFVPQPGKPPPWGQPGGGGGGGGYRGGGAGASYQGKLSGGGGGGSSFLDGLTNAKGMDAVYDKAANANGGGISLIPPPPPPPTVSPLASAPVSSDYSNSPCLCIGIPNPEYSETSATMSAPSMPAPIMPAPIMPAPIMPAPIMPAPIMPAPAANSSMAPTIFSQEKMTLPNTAKGGSRNMNKARSTHYANKKGGRRAAQTKSRKRSAHKKTRKGRR